MSARKWFDSARGAIFQKAAALAVVAGFALPAYGGGPLAVVNQQAVVYPNGGTSLTLNLDQGPLGARTNAQATAIVQNAIAMWNVVPTSTMRLTIGEQLAADYTTANYASIYQRWNDGLNPVIFDADGSLTDALFGAGAKSSVLGFAGSAYYTSGSLAGKYAEGQAVINGYINISDATLREVLAHEFGHFFGLDHSQLDSTQGLATTNYVLMYPIAYRTLPTLHEDDVAAVTSLYPAANVSSTYGQLTGSFTTAGGTPILGANIWTRETSTGKVYSIVSDFMMQGNGYFRLYLPAGTYTLNAESISSSFTGGSRVGPYSSSASSASFQAPHPITPVAWGGGSGQPIVISAGCLATASFRLDGTGSVSGNCSGSTPAPTTTALTTSGSPATVGSTVTWTATVAGTAPTGTVNFKDGGTTIAGCGAVVLNGSGNSRTAVCSSSALAVGVHSIVADYSGNAANAASTSNTVSQVINAAGGSSNVALASAGAVTSASSTLGGYPLVTVNDNERAGVNWSLGGGGWADSSPDAYPDWVQINFNGSKTIDRVVVFTLQDNFLNPVEPTDNLTFAQYGIKDFSVQGWNGSAWVTLATIAGNNQVRRTVSFNAFTTDRIRVNVTNALAQYARITEVEAWTASGAASVTNVALAGNGAVASASSTLSGYPLVTINDNERAGSGWSLGGGGWADATPDAYPDSVQIIFNGSKTIDRIVIYTLQDNFLSPIEPADSQTFALYGIKDFSVQGWNGSAWVTLGTVANNNLVKRTLTFTPFTTDRIRVNVTNTLAQYARITEIEAWGE